MDEKMLKTSWKQRLFIAIIAALLLGSSIAVYVAIVLGANNTDYSSMTTSQLETAYQSALDDLNARAAVLSSEHFENFSSYRSKVKAFNSTTANSNGVQSKDLKEGDGEDLTDSNYSAYYIGYCSDETIFDSSFDDYDNPTSLSAPLVVEPNALIEGWYLGMDGAKVGTVREITIPGSLAYGDSYEICGGYNTPLKFIVYTFPRDEEVSKLQDRLTEIYTAMYTAYAQQYSTIDYSDYETDAETSGE